MVVALGIGGRSIINQEWLLHGYAPLIIAQFHFTDYLNSKRNHLGPFLTSSIQLDFSSQATSGNNPTQKC